MNRLVATCIAFGAIACAKPSAPPLEVTETRDASFETNVVAIDAATNDASPPTDAGPADRKLKSAKSIGHTSVVFKLKFEDESAAAYKPTSERGGTRYRGEIAAYRLARALGLDNVPPAEPMKFQRGALRAVMQPGPALALFDAEVKDAAGWVDGAFIPWIDKLEFLPLETPVERAKWKAWLKKDGAVADSDRAIAAQISTMIVFDFVTANWDRWSGGNVGFDRAKSRVLFIDNDGAFFEPPPKPALDAQLALLQSCDRYSKRLVADLRALDEEKLKAIFGEDETAPLLGAKVIHAVDARRKKALAILETKSLDFD